MCDFLFQLTSSFVIDKPIKFDQKPIRGFQPLMSFWFDSITKKRSFTSIAPISLCNCNEQWRNACIKSRTSLYNPLQFIPVLDRWTNLLFSSKTCWSCVVCTLIGNCVRVKSSEWPRGWQMPGPRDWQGGQMPCSSPKGGKLAVVGIDWCIMGSSRIRNQVKTYKFVCYKSALIYWLYDQKQYYQSYLPKRYQ